MARRRKAGGGRTTPSGTRPRNWSGGSGGTGAGMGHTSSARMERPPPLYDVLVQLSGLMPNMVPTGFAGAPDMTAIADAVTNELAIGDENIEALVLVATLLGDQELIDAVTLRRSPGEAIAAMVDLINSARVVEAFEVREPFDERRQYVISVRLSNGEDLTLMTMVEPFGGTVLLDAFVLPTSVSEIKRALLDEPELTITNAGLGEVRLALDEAIEIAHSTVPPIVTETWPDHCLITEWIVRLLPDTSDTSDATEPVEWEPMSPEVEQALVNDFLASDQRQSLKLDDDTVTGLLSSLLWFKDGYTNGDIHRWGPYQISFLLEDWALRKLMIDDDELRAIPALLRALVPWSHGQLDDVHRHHTAEVLSAIDELEPGFVDDVEGDGPQDIDALVAATRRALGFTGDIDIDYPILEASWRADAVGGADILDTLTDDPLPDEALDLDGVAEPYRSLVNHIASRSAAVAGALYGPEFATAATRVAVRLGELDGKALARGNPETAGAGIVWMTAAANGLGYSIVQADIKDAFGTKASPKDRARTFVKVLGGKFEEYRPINLGSPDFLVGSRRRQLIDEHQAAQSGD